MMIEMNQNLMQCCGQGRYMELLAAPRSIFDNKKKLQGEREKGNEKDFNICQVDYEEGAN